MCLLPVTGVRLFEVNMQGVCIKRISLMAKVLHIDQPVQVSTNLTKQDVIIPDSTASAKLTLWEGNLNILNGVNSRVLLLDFTNRKNISPFPKKVLLFYTY